MLVAALVLAMTGPAVKEKPPASDSGVGATSAITRCSYPSLTIPSGPATVTDDLVVGDSQTITDLNISVDANHAWVSDLTVRVEYVNSNTTIRLFESKCGSSDDVRSEFDDEGPSHSCASSATVIRAAV